MSEEQVQTEKAATGADEQIQGVAATGTGEQGQAQDYVIEDDAEQMDQAAQEKDPAPEPESESAASETVIESPERPINQEAVQKKINKAIREKYEEQEKRKAIEAELEQARQKLAAADKQDIVIPEMPDAFDPEFDSKIRARDEALRQAAIRQAQADIERQNTEKAMREKAEADRSRINGYVESMFSNAKQLGIKEADLRAADDTVAMFIRDPGLATYILSQKDAPLIINHLAGNISELENISRMSPIEAAAHIASSVIPEAQKYKPVLPTTPDPIDIPAGKAKGIKQSPFLDGVTFE